MSARPWLERAIEPDTIGPGLTRKYALYVYLPGDQDRAERWLRKVLGTRVTLTPVRYRGVMAWKLTAPHLIPLAGEMAYAYGLVKVRLEILVETDRCDMKCQNAVATSVYECVCSCAGEHHGGKGANSDWYRSGRSTLVQYAKTQIDQLVIPSGLIPAHEKVPRPAPAIMPVIVRPPVAPQPEYRPRPVASPPRPNLAATPPPHPVAPAVAHVGNPEPAPHFAPPAAVPPSPPRGADLPPVPRVRTVVAAIAGVAAVAGLAWVFAVATPHHPDAQPPVTGVVTPIQSPAPAPPPPPVPPQPRRVQASVAPSVPPGCYPFESGC